MNDEYYERTGKRKKSLTVTYGCQMNEHDSEKILWVLKELNYRETKSMEDADLIIFNTCLIRENAELKVYGQVGSLKAMKKEKPELLIALCGCMMQVENSRESILKTHRHIDIVFGTKNIDKLPQLIEKTKYTNDTVVDIIEDDYEIIEDIGANRLYDFKGSVNIMYGCNNFCTYCVVPYARGREKSREPEHILEEVRDMARAGYKEITLLGQNVNSYGKTFDSDYNFPKLLLDIDKIAGIERIRFMTSHPRDLSDELIEAMASSKKICNHIHLPVQSGSSRILKEMNRHYDREKYVSLVKKLREANPGIAISTDIIVGFPGETEEDFEETLSLVREIQYDAAFCFIYSVREGTKAANMEDQIPETVKHERFQRLLDTIYPIFHKKNEESIGKVVEVLVESVSKNNDQVLTGRSDDFKLVHFPGDPSLIGQIVKVKVNSCTSFTLSGTLV